MKKALEIVFVGGGWTAAVSVLVAAQVLAFFLQALAGEQLFASLALGGGRPGPLDPWRWISFVLATDRDTGLGGLQLVTNVLVFGIVAGEVSHLLGPRRFLAYYFLTVLGAAAGGFLYDMSFPVYGAIGPAAGAVLAFGLLEPTRRIYGRIPARVYAAFLLAILVGAHFAIFHRESVQGVNVWSFVSQATGAAGAGYLFFLLRPVFRRRSLVRNMFRQLRTMQEEQAIRERVDRLLEKISRESLESLSKEERRFLRRASRRFQETRDRGEGGDRSKAKSENSFPT